MRASTWPQLACRIHDVDLVIFAGFTFREFAILVLFTKFKFREFSFFFNSAIILKIREFVFLEKFAKI